MLWLVKRFAVCQEVIRSDKSLESFIFLTADNYKVSATRGVATRKCFITRDLFCFVLFCFVLPFRFPNPWKA